MSMRGHDHGAIPLGATHHRPGFHDGGPPFDRMTKAERKAWQAAMVASYQPCTCATHQSGVKCAGPWKRVAEAF